MHMHQWSRTADLGDGSGRHFKMCKRCGKSKIVNTPSYDPDDWEPEGPDCD